MDKYFGSSIWPVRRFEKGESHDCFDKVAEEVPVALVYNGISHVVMLATPADLEDFALGFSLTEGILASPEEMYACEIVEAENGIRIELDISSERFLYLKERRRNLAGRTGCGLCGTDSLSQEGLRLIEVKKNQLFRLPSLLEQLAENPLKFIIFIDDLSFAGNDEHFAALKATLEGSVTACAKNTVIYATSNRRHLVKETMEERSGDDIHLNDTLQELMSLSARFGMTITFQKPDKDGYLAIVKHLAKEYGLEMSEEELCTKAEGFAIRQNGRSPRTAKHFVETQLAKL